MPKTKLKPAIQKTTNVARSSRSSKQKTGIRRLLFTVRNLQKKQLVMIVFVLIFGALGAYLLRASYAYEAARTHDNWVKIAPPLRQCESGGNYATNTGNGYYGAYQFSLKTWQALGGAGYPHQAAASEQDRIAEKLFIKSGINQWPVCGPKASKAAGIPDASSNPPPSGGGSSCESQTLRKGSTGSCVTYLQNKLNNFGAGLKADGSFGAGTDTAVRNFQSGHGLTADGVVGANTWKALNGGTTSGTATNQNPKGSVDRFRCDSSVGGWAYDPDNTDANIAVHVYIDGPAGSGASAFGVSASGDRPDVRSAFGITGNHGFDLRIPDQYRNGAAHSVYVYAINTPDGSNPQIGSGTTEACY